MRLKIFIMCFILSLVSLCAFAQDSGRTITGTVQDAKGNPLVGAVVMQPGSSNGAVTDADGAFSIEVSGGGTVTLEVSILGYVTKSFSLPEKQDVSFLRKAVLWAFSVPSRHEPGRRKNFHAAPFVPENRENRWDGISRRPVSHSDSERV